MSRIVGTIVALLAAAVLVMAATSCSPQGELRPVQADESASNVIADQPQLVTFPELQADPDSYRNVFIRVTGTFLRLPPPECIIYSGPHTDWSLVSDSLRLDVIGFEKSIPIVTDGIDMTVDGIFRQYEGPLGCGKRPASGVSWYLEATRIVQPNPLARVIRAPGQPEIGPFTTPGFEPTLPGTAFPQLTEGAPVVTPIQPTTSVPTPTPSPGTTIGAIPTATPSPTAGTLVATSLPTGTPSPGPGTPTATRTPTPSPLPSTVTPSPASPTQPIPGPTQPPISTATPGGYPIPPTPEDSPTASYP